MSSIEVAWDDADIESKATKKSGETLKVFQNLPAGSESEQPVKTSEAYCIQAGGTGGVETESDGYIPADKLKNLLRFGEVLWVTNARVKLLAGNK